MRKFLLISLLATTMATPALAQDRGDFRGDRSEQANTSSQEPGSRRSERSESRRSSDGGQGQSQSQPRPERVRPVMPERPQDMVQQPSGSSRRGRGDDDFVAPAAPSAGDTVRNWRRGGGNSGSVQTQDGSDSVRNWRGRDRRPDSPSEIQDRNLGVSPADTVVDRRTIEERNLRRAGDGSFDRNVRTTPGFGGRVRRIGNNVPVEGTAPPPVSTEVARRGTTSHRWSHDWRRDGRYDWRRYRDRNRSRFHFSFYFDPFGWSYRRYNIGYRLWPSYYQQDYWLSDPWQYRLPPAYGPYRWVRYYDDALLVNIYTGTVVDVIYNFFW